MIKEKLQGNIWKYAILLITNKRVFVAVLGAYYLTIPNVTAQSIGLILLIGNVAGFLLEVPSGYLSDKIGHKQTLVMSRVLMLMSTAFFLFAKDLTFVILGSVFLSASFAFMSGTGSAFMHETLRALGKEHDYTKIMGKVSSIGFAVPIVFMVLVPFLVSVSYQTPFLIALILDLIGLFVTISLVVPPVPQEEIKEVGPTNFRQVIQEGHRLGYFSLALFSGIIGATLSAVGGFRAPYQIFLEIPVIWFGVLFGTGRALASLMLAFSGRIKTKITMLSLYRFQLSIYTALLLVLGMVSTWWIVVAVFIIANALQWGLSKISEGYELDVIRSSKFKATILSTGSLIEQIIAGVLGFGLGLMIEKFSYQYGFLSVGIIFFALLFPLYLYIARREKLGAYKNTVIAK